MEYRKKFKTNESPKQISERLIKEFEGSGKLNATFTEIQILAMHLHYVETKKATDTEKILCQILQGKEYKFEIIA